MGATVWVIESDDAVAACLVGHLRKRLPRNQVTIITLADHQAARAALEGPDVPDVIIAGGTQPTQTAADAWALLRDHDLIERVELIAIGAPEQEDADSIYPAIRWMDLPIEPERTLVEHISHQLGLTSG